MRVAYDSIYFELRKLIEDGTYAYRTLLPSETALVKRYGCAHNTVRKALSILAAHGYVQPIHGKGVRVTYLPPSGSDKKLLSLNPNGIESFNEAAKRCGFAPSTKIVLMESIEVDEALAQNVPFDLGQQLLHVVRIRHYNGKPLSWEDCYVREDLVEGITVEDAQDSIHAYIKSARGAKLVTSQRTIVVEHANKQDNKFLQMGDSDFVASIRINSFDHDGLLGEHRILHHHPDAFLLRQTVIESRVSK